MGDSSAFWELLLNTTYLARLYGEAARGSALLHMVNGTLNSYL